MIQHYYTVPAQHVSGVINWMRPSMCTLHVTLYKQVIFYYFETVFLSQESEAIPNTYHLDKRVLMTVNVRLIKYKVNSPQNVAKLFQF